jgi:hypothetical protein
MGINYWLPGVVASLVGRSGVYLAREMSQPTRESYIRSLLATHEQVYNPHRDVMGSGSSNKSLKRRRLRVRCNQSGSAS